VSPEDRGDEGKSSRRPASGLVPVPLKSRSQNGAADILAERPFWDLTTNGGL